MDYLGLIRHKNLLYQVPGMIGEAFFQMGKKLLALCYLIFRKANRQADDLPQTNLYEEVQLTPVTEISPNNS